MAILEATWLTPLNPQQVCLTPSPRHPPALPVDARMSVLTACRAAVLAHTGSQTDQTKWSWHRVPLSPHWSPQPRPRSRAIKGLAAALGRGPGHGGISLFPRLTSANQHLSDEVRFCSSVCYWSRGHDTLATVRPPHTGPLVHKC